MHPLLILTGKVMIDSIPGMTEQISWTSVNLLYLAVCYSALYLSRLYGHT